MRSVGGQVASSECGGQRWGCVCAMEGKRLAGVFLGIRLIGQAGSPPASHKKLWELWEFFQPKYGRNMGIFSKFTMKIYENMGNYGRPCAIFFVLFVHLIAFYILKVRFDLLGRFINRSPQFLILLMETEIPPHHI